MSSRLIKVDSLFEQQPFSAYQWRILFLCFLIILLDGFDTAVMAYVAPAIIQEWGIAKTLFGPAMSAALFGLAVGSFLAGRAADRFGRKRIILLSVFIFGLASVASSFSHHVDTLSWLRFLTGIGLGGALPSTVSLMTEYTPTARRSLIVCAMFSSFPLGAALGGIVSSWLIPAMGWRSVFILGGLAPLVLWPILYYVLPESLHFLLQKKQAVKQVYLLLQRMWPHCVFQANDRLSSEDELLPANARTLIFSRPYLVGTLMLALTYFLGLLLFYLLLSWLPLLLYESGMQIKQATLLTALFSLSGFIGAILIGWLMDRYNPHYVPATAFFFTALLVCLIGQISTQSGFLAFFIGLSGLALSGAQASLPSLAARFYPVQCRASGVGWMLGMGRFGGIAGAFWGAKLSHYLTFDAFFTFLTLPAFFAACALLVKSRF